MSRVTVALALVLFTCSGVWAATTPTDALRQVFAQADKILTSPDTAERPLERFLGFRKLVSEAFDFKGAAELASGDHWQARTVAEQEEFTWLFSDLLERGFVARMAAKANLEGGTRIKYLTESVEGGTALVQTTMALRNGGAMLLDYELVERSGAWKIRDVAIDGVSVMANYRAQLDRVLGNASFSELLTQMRARAVTIEPRARTAVSSPEPAVIADTALAGKRESAPDGSPPAPPIASGDVAPRPAVPIVDAPAAAPAPRVAAVGLIATAPPVEPTEAAVTPPPRTRTTRAYWLEISTVEVAEAGRLVSRLRDDKLAVALERTTADGKPMVHVRVGPFEDAEEAVFKLLDLQTKGHDPFLVAERD